MTIGAGTSWLVLHDMTHSIFSTGTRTWVDTLVVAAAAIKWTISVDHTLWPAALRGVPDQARQTGTMCSAPNYPAFSVVTTGTTTTWRLVLHYMGKGCHKTYPGEE